VLRFENGVIELSLLSCFFGLEFSLVDLTLEDSDLIFCLLLLLSEGEGEGVG
jgi:hypothetical protein